MCKEPVLSGATRCKHCGADLRSWPRRHPVILAITSFSMIFMVAAVVVVLMFIYSGAKRLEAAADRAPQPLGTTKWYMQADKSPMTDKQRVVFSLASDQDVSGKNPRLVVRCEDGNLSIYIDGRWSFSPEDDDRRTVTYRFDAKQPVHARLRVSAGDEEAVFFDRPDLWMEAMSKADSLLVQYSSLTWGSQTVRFPVSGFGAVGRSAIRGCLAH